MFRGTWEDEATALVVGGCAESITKEIPLEYVVEPNTLIKLQIEAG